MLSFISCAIAEEANQISASNILQQSNLSSLLPFILIFCIFYFILIRPQVKKQKEHVSMLDSLKKGEKVVTTGGIVGHVSKIEDKIVYIEVAPEIKIKFIKSAISEILDREKDTKVLKEKIKELKEEQQNNS
ncbi:preprotein translocase subunit YajC [Rickettsiales bacterium Ac37b]|nr:preprotein translocase subunit YajC [Rickettsiales bacterium Ac37b]